MAPQTIALDRVFSHRSESHDTAIHWTTLGPDTGPPLVFIHGTPWSSFVWTAYAQSLERFKIYLFDHPGYGQSPARKPLTSDDPGDVDVSFAGLAESFAALYQSWGFSPGARPHVIAHDIGGVIALRAFLLHGCQYASLCLIDVVALRPFGSPFYRLVGQNASVFNSIPDSIYEGMLGAYIKGAAFAELRHDVANGLLAPWLPGGTQGQAGFIRQIAQADERHVAEVEGRYPEIGAQIPVEIIWGKQDTWIPVEQAKRLGDAVGTSNVVTIDEAGHLIMFDQPVRLATEIAIWLMRVAG